MAQRRSGLPRVRSGWIFNSFAKVMLPRLRLSHRAEQHEGNRASDADIISLDALGGPITQSDQICALHEISDIARLDRREPAQALSEKQGGSRGIGKVGFG